ncbi:MULTISPECIES: ATP-binding protein [unclassified Pseudomonas]|uniref:ATP-binding protein n=1 Tax=unclassified Pseudomonas TaxID=196821 RepID=UPI0010F764E5|nr:MULTISPECIES: ATP-binding protein [unclassified Pseudomonas]
MASKTSFEALPIGNAPCGRGAKAEQEIALSNETRFPSGATIDQVKKDAKKLAKAQGIPLHQAQDAAALKHGLALPWNRVNEWLAGQSRSAIASFTLPLDNGETKTVNLTSEQPLVIVCGWVGCGKSTTALVLAGQAMATTNARLFFLTSKPVGWPPAVWDSLYRDFPGRCLEVGDVHNFDLAQINPTAGDIVILDERYQGARNQSLQRLIEQARLWKVGLFVCKQGGPSDMEFELTKSHYPDRGIPLIVEGKGGFIRHGEHATFTATGFEQAKASGQPDRTSWTGKFTITVSKPSVLAKT